MTIEAVMAAALLVLLLLMGVSAGVALRNETTTRSGTQHGPPRG